MARRSNARKRIFQIGSLGFGGYAEPGPSDDLGKWYATAFAQARVDTLILGIPLLAFALFMAITSSR